MIFRVSSMLMKMTNTYSAICGRETAVQQAADFNSIVSIPWMKIVAGITMNSMQKEISLDAEEVTVLKAVVSISGTTLLKSAILR